MSGIHDRTDRHRQTTQRPPPPLPSAATAAAVPVSWGPGPCPCPCMQCICRCEPEVCHDHLSIQARKQPSGQLLAHSPHVHLHYLQSNKYKYYFIIYEPTDLPQSSSPRRTDRSFYPTNYHMYLSAVYTVHTVYD